MASPAEIRAGRRWVLRRLGATGACGHFTDAPEPMFFLGWEQLVLCAACARTSLGRLDGSEQNLTCDRCHQVEGGGETHSVRFEVGGVPTCVAWALCNGCAAAVLREDTFGSRP